MSNNINKKIDIEILHTLEDMRKMNAETNTITKKTILYPFVVAIVFVKLFLN